MDFKTENSMNPAWFLYDIQRRQQLQTTSRGFNGGGLWRTGTMCTRPWTPNTKLRSSEFFLRWWRGAGYFEDCALCTGMHATCFLENLILYTTSATWNYLYQQVLLPPLIVGSLFMLNIAISDRAFCDTNIVPFRTAERRLTNFSIHARAFAC